VQPSSGAAPSGFANSTALIASLSKALMEATDVPASGYLDFARRIRICAFERPHLRTARDGAPLRADEAAAPSWEIHLAVKEQMTPSSLERIDDSARRALARGRAYVAVQAQNA
jgi:hypothetical protein